jgi:hypothetical protein
MNKLNTLLIIVLFILIMVIYFKKENFTSPLNFNNDISDVEKKIKSLEFAMASMKDPPNFMNSSNNTKKPYKTVYNYY